MLEIDTPEKLEKLIEAFKAADKRGPLTTDVNLFEELEKGREHMRRHRR
ncbi:MAG: hypothetical protein LBR42_01060 [Candidatus Methanoplasma sp.]|jgi:hypothetical protein|nr:hypothetical protein [Candidatus Methanoplasma sp.]